MSLCTRFLEIDILLISGTAKAACISLISKKTILVDGDLNKSLNVYSGDEDDEKWDELKHDNDEYNDKK